MATDAGGNVYAADEMLSRVVKITPDGTLSTIVDGSIVNGPLDVAVERNGNPLIGIMDNRWKYIKTTRPELYNLVEDPEEKNNLAEEKKTVAESMDELLLQTLKEQLREDIEDNKMALDEDAMERLASLGYVGGSVDGNYEFDQTRTDPKDLIGYHKLNSIVAAFFMQNDYNKAKLFGAQMIKNFPDIHLGHNWMAKIAVNEDDSEAAIRHLSEASRLAPDRFDLHSNLGNVYSTSGNIEEGIRHYYEALRINPDCRNAHIGLGIVLANQDKIEESVFHYAEALRIDHDNAMAHMGLGNILLLKGEHEDAAVQYRHVLRVNPDNVEAHLRLGDVMINTSRMNKAIDHYTEAFKLAPDNPQAKNKLRNALIAQSEIRSKLDIH